MFLAGFLFFLGFARATAVYQARVDLRPPLLVGFFLAGLVIHGGLQSWWIAPVLASLTEHKLYLGATILTAFNDNALITYLATLVPNLDERLKLAVVEGAVTGGGLTVIANAPNPAGQALLGRFFDGAILPIWLAAGALLPTLIAMAVFRLL
jgi:predicted cation transporter